MPTALTIAGSDSGGGAGIQADLKTFAAFGVFGTSAITAITAQNTTGVTAVETLSTSIIAAQIDAVVIDLGADAVKIGMLATSAIIQTVAAALDRHGLTTVVLDPVMVAKGGDHLLRQDAVTALRDILLPRARVITPNIPEAEALTGLAIRSVEDQLTAARRLVDLGAHSAIVKGGHGAGDAVDVWTDGSHTLEVRAPRIETRHTHGTGCTFSSAIAAGLALGEDLPTAIRHAKTYVTGAITHAPGLGRGHGPLHHFWRP